MKILKHQHWHLLILIGLLYALNQYTNQDSNVFNGSLWNISTKNWFILAILSPIKQSKPFDIALDAKKSFGKYSLDLTSTDI